MREIVAFDIAITRDMGIKGGKTKGSFVDTTMSQVSAFYGDVLQDIQAWHARAPRLKVEHTEPEVIEPVLEQNSELSRSFDGQNPNSEYGHDTELE
jgi:hypothetical protein